MLVLIKEAELEACRLGDGGVGKSMGCGTWWSERMGEGEIKLRPSGPERVYGPTWRAHGESVNGVSLRVARVAHGESVNGVSLRVARRSPPVLLSEALEAPSIASKRGGMPWVSSVPALRAQVAGSLRLLH